MPTPHRQKAIALLTLTQPVNAIAHQYNLSPQSVRRYREQLRKGRYAWIKAEGAERCTNGRLKPKLNYL